MHKIVLLGLLILLSGCVVDDEVRIGGLYHLTGDGALWGTTEYNAVTLAIEEINAAGGINGLPVRHIIEDGKTDYAGTTSALQKLINVDGVHAVIGPTWFGQISASLAEEYEEVMITPSAGVTVPREKYYFNLWHPEFEEMFPLLGHMVQNEYRKVAVVYSLNDWSTSISRQFIAEANVNGVEIVADIATDGFETDFSTVVTKLSTLDIDAIFGPIAFYSSQGAFNRELSEQGLDVPVYSGSGMEIPALVETYPEVEGTIYSYPQTTEKEKMFQERYAERFGNEQSPSAANAYDAVYLLAEVIAEVGTDPKDIAEALEGRIFSGINTFLIQDGRVQKKAHDIKQIIDGEFVIVS